MTVTIIVTSEGYVADVSGAGYNAVGEIKLRKCDNAELTWSAISNMLEVKKFNFVFFYNFYFDFKYI